MAVLFVKKLIDMNTLTETITSKNYTLTDSKGCKTENVCRQLW